MSTQEKSFDFSQSRSQILTVQSVRIFFLTVVFLAFLAYQLVNTHFIAQGVFFSVYGLLTFSFLLNFIYILLFQERNSWIGFFTALLFVWEVFFVTLLIYFIGVNQSLLIFLYLINIILCGIVFKRRGGVYLALVTSICFSFLLASDPQWQGNTLYMATGINNLAFFAVAYLSGYLSEQLNVMGLELLERGRDIRALKNLNSLIVEGMPSGQMTIDSKGIILQANEQAQKIFGKTAATILNENIQTLIPPFKDFVSKLTTGPTAELRTQDDRILRLSFSPLSDEQGARLGSILLIDDITGFKKLESRVMQSEKLAKKVDVHRHQRNRSPQPSHHRVFGVRPTCGCRTFKY
jgi:two-component system sensor histidine kinase PilS (NtrC family)